MKKNYRAYILNWTTIDQVGKIKLLQSSFIIFFLLPFIAQFIEKYKINFSIPISWLLIYYSTLFISIGTIVYAIFCPQIVKKFESYDLFIKSGRGGSYLYNEISTLTKSKLGNQEELINILIDQYTFAHYKNDSGVKNIIRTSIWAPEKDDFWFVHNSLNYSKPYLRLVCTIFYFCGFILLLIFFIEKVITVTKYFWS